MVKNTAFVLPMIALAMSGVMAMLLVPFEVLLPGDVSPILKRLLSIIQPAILSLVFAVVGSFLAPRVGFDAPLVRGWLAGDVLSPLLRRIVSSGLLMSVQAAAVLIVYTLVSNIYFNSISPDVATLMTVMDLPLITKVLYGGVTEEIIVRWGMMSLVVWVIWRFVGQPVAVSDVHVWCGIVTATLVFALLHVPLLFAFDTAPPHWIVAAVIAGNGIVGTLYGWLFWKYGIEAAMIAHGMTHVLATGFLKLM
jgi:hypothetical protein